MLTAVAVVATRPDITWTQACGLFIVLQLPFDVVGGWWLPRRHGRSEDTRVWPLRWLRGVLVHGGLMWGLGTLALALGPEAGLLALGLSGVVLMAVQGSLVTLVGTGHDRSFSGGWVGLPGLERMIRPERWTGLARDVAERRRVLAVETGARARGVIAALAFNLTGLVVVASWDGAGTGSSAQLLGLAAGTSLWSFLGLLTLPTLSRHAVHALDALAAGELGSDRVAQAILALESDQEAEHERPRSVGQIFYPVPAPAARLAALDRAPPRRFAWRVARSALFASQGQLSWLSRAVHCNSGRPELWMLPPGD